MPIIVMTRSKLRSRRNATYWPGPTPRACNAFATWFARASTCANVIVSPLYSRAMPDGRDGGVVRDAWRARDEVDEVAALGAQRVELLAHDGDERREAVLRIELHDGRQRRCEQAARGFELLARRPVDERERHVVAIGE